MAVATRSPRGRNLRWAKASVGVCGSLSAAPPSSERLPLLRIPVLTDSAANLLERVRRRQALERGADLRDDAVESLRFTRPVDDQREAERPVHDQGRISWMELQRL